MPSVPSTNGSSGTATNGSSGTAKAGRLADVLIYPKAVVQAPLPKFDAVGNPLKFLDPGTWFDIAKFRLKIDQHADAPVAMSAAVASGDTSHVNEEAYAANPATAPRMGDVFDASGTRIGRQTSTGFYGG